MDARKDHTTFVPAFPRSAFDAAIVLTIEDGLKFVDDAAEVRRLLPERFPDPDGASFKRALSACDACLLGNLGGATARIMSIVATMEAGFPFEMIKDTARALDSRTELEVEPGLRSILLGKVLPE